MGLLSGMRVMKEWYKHRVLYTFVGAVSLVIISTKSMGVYQRSDYRSTPGGFNRFCEDKANAKVCQRPHKFKHFVWMLVDGLSIDHSSKLRSVFEVDSSEHTQSYRVLNTGEPMSNAIYTSYMTGVMATNVQGDPIEGDSIFRQMNYHGLNVHFTGPEWPMMQLYPSSKGVFNSTEFVDNEELVFPQMFEFDDKEEEAMEEMDEKQLEQEGRWENAKNMLDKYKEENRSLFMVTTTVDTLSHRIGAQADKTPLDKVGDRWGENMRAVKEWLDVNPDTLFIYMADHGQQEGSKLHGDVRGGNEPMFFMYSPQLEQHGERLKWVDTVDVCGTISQMLEIDIPGDSIGFAHSASKDPKMTFTLAYRNAVQVKGAAKRMGVPTPDIPVTWEDANTLLEKDDPEAFREPIVALQGFIDDIKDPLLNLKVFPVGLFVFSLLLWLWLAVPITKDLWVERNHPSHTTASLIDDPQPHSRSPRHHDSHHTPIVLPRGTLAASVYSWVYRVMVMLQGRVPRGIAAIGSNWNSRIPISRFLGVIFTWAVDSATWMTPHLVWALVDLTLIYWRMELHWEKMALGLMFVPLTGLIRSLAVSSHLVSAFGKATPGFTTRSRPHHHQPHINQKNGPVTSHEMGEVMTLVDRDLHQRNNSNNYSGEPILPILSTSAARSLSHTQPSIPGEEEEEEEENKRISNIPVKSALRSALLLGAAISLMWVFILPSAVEFVKEYVNLYKVLPFRLAYSVALLATAWHIRPDTFETHPCPGLPRIPVPSLGGVQVFLALVVGAVSHFRVGLWGALLIGFIEITRCISAPSRRQRELLVPLTALIYAISDPRERYRLMFGMVVPALCVAGAARTCPRAAIPKTSTDGTPAPTPSSVSLTLPTMACFLIFAISVWRYPASGGVYTAFAPLRVAYNLMENPENYPYFCLMVLVIHKFAVYLVAVGCCVVVSADHAVDVAGGSRGGAITMSGGITSSGGQRRGASIQLGWDDEVQVEHERLLDSLFRWVGVRAVTLTVAFIIKFIYSPSFDHHLFFMIQIITTALLLATARLLPRLMVLLRTALKM